MLGQVCRPLYTSVRQRAMDLRSLVGHLEAIAPSSRAESWDNVGLLVEPSGNPPIHSALLTVDLTEQVLSEARGLGAGLIISYHPPIFHALKRLTQRSAKERVVVQAVEQGIAVYSPHTALDCLEGGVNDWLLAGLGQGSVRALHLHTQPSSPDRLLTIHGVEDSEEKMGSLGLSGKTITRKPSSSNPQLCDVELPCTEAELASLLLQLHSSAPTCHLSLHTRPEVPVAGGGRVLALEQPVSLPELVARVKSHLSLAHVRLAQPASWTEQQTVSTVAACAGSGATVLRGTQADVYLTGEMGHHDVLAATSRGVAVILCEHSNTERGFLSHYRSLLQARVGPGLAVALALSDSDPLIVV